MAAFRLTLQVKVKIVSRRRILKRGGGKSISNGFANCRQEISVQLRFQAKVDRIPSRMVITPSIGAKQRTSNIEYENGTNFSLGRASQRQHYLIVVLSLSNSNINNCCVILCKILTPTTKQQSQSTWPRNDQ